MKRRWWSLLLLCLLLTGCSAADTLTQLSVTYEKHLEKNQDELRTPGLKKNRINFMTG